jgi:hypothetical protein
MFCTHCLRFIASPDASHPSRRSEPDHEDGTRRSLDDRCGGAAKGESLETAAAVGPDHHEPRTYRLRVLHDHLDTRTLNDGDFTRRTGVTEQFFETTFFAMA